MFPSIPDSDAAKADSAINTLKGKVVKLGKDIASEGGKIGPMAVQEWKIVADMVTALEQSKGTEAFKDRLDDVEMAARGLATRITEGFADAHSSSTHTIPTLDDAMKAKRGERAKIKEREKAAPEVPIEDLVNQYAG